ncbi:MAG TPA: DUF5640 domain-containing protein [Bryobacteraceae bacterium]|nr:DUF5640 domain-containing protein [Bryobacteraceae bacterium]
MKVKSCVLLVACVVLLLSACGSSPQSLILGKWEVQNAPMKMTAEFKDDGTASVTMMGQTMRGNYKLNGDELEWLMGGRSTKAKVKVTSTELELTDDQNRTIKYKRI